MGTHPIFESDFDCLTEMAEQDKEAQLKSYMDRLPPPTQAELEALASYASTTGGVVGLAGGLGIGMFFISKVKSRGLGFLGAFTNSVVGFTVGQTVGTKRNFQSAMETGQFDANFPAGGLKECLKASITGVPPDPDEMEQYLKQPEKMNISRQQYQQGVHLQPQPPQTGNPPEMTPCPSATQAPSLDSEKKYNKYGDEIFDDKKS